MRRKEGRTNGTKDIRKNNRKYGRKKGAKDKEEGRNDV